MPVVSAWRWNVSSLTFQVIGVHSFNLCCDILFLLSKQPVQTGRCECRMRRKKFPACICFIGETISWVSLSHWFNHTLSWQRQVYEHLCAYRCTQLNSIKTAVSFNQRAQIHWARGDERGICVKDWQNRLSPVKPTRLVSHSIISMKALCDLKVPLIFSFSLSLRGVMLVLSFKKKVKHTEHLESDEEKVFESHTGRNSILFWFVYSVCGVFLQYRATVECKIHQ